MFTLNLLTPFHTAPSSFIYLFIYLKLPDERYSVTTVITPRSALFAQTSGKYSECLLAGVLYNDVWTVESMFCFFVFFCGEGMKKQLKMNYV